PCRQTKGTTILSRSFLANELETSFPCGRAGYYFVRGEERAFGTVYLIKVSRLSNLQAPHESKPAILA
uniref:Uncharacterized protein n=1 Tax=Aegilops tauschii subsp. strangulata TaxID=200361 RepID=A0A453C4R9_AEGTS